MGQTAVEHGVNAYAKGRCRCARCRRAWNIYTRVYRQRTQHSAAKPTAREAGYYRSKLPGMRVKLTDLGAQIVEARVAQTGKSPDDVIEAALRCCGAEAFGG